ncbi:Sugar transporter ERD6-like 11 [Citrus sinensis]|uniref:Sugar transporter ERD6-like 11 n=1 Tax=Citrus sinensis TaxID=2711 RepID=A0ACB8KK15_CITSI|nr:Sugar transporter ERD6-like 11 [Citrus sinensis]
MQGSDSSAIPAVILSTLVAICGSVAYGCSVGYSSPVEAGITADLGLSLIEDAWSLYLGRCSLGIGLALMTYVLLVASGLSVIYLVGSVVSWRALALIAAVPCLLQVVGLFFIPESPRWLAKIGKEKELETTLQRLRGKTADISMESADIQDYTQTFKNDSRAGIFDLFQRKYAYSLSVGVGLMVMQPLVGSAAIAYYASYIFAAADLLTAIIQASAIGTCLSLSIIALAFCLQDTNHWNEVTPVLVYIGIMESINKPLNFQFSDISYKHQRFSRKPGDSTPQLQQLDSYIHFPFHDGMEHNRNIFYILGHLCCSCPIRCISGAGDQGTNT